MALGTGSEWSSPTGVEDSPTQTSAHIIAQLTWRLAALLPSQLGVTGARPLLQLLRQHHCSSAESVFSCGVSPSVFYFVLLFVFLSVKVLTE